MPANRSRTENWKASLEQIVERGGCLELAIRRDQPTGIGGDPNYVPPPDLLWRVKVGSAFPKLIVEQPAAAGAAVTFNEGAELIAAMTIGQNRWMFTTRVVATRPGAMQLEHPERVERCSRREHFRISTAGLRLPDVRCWPLKDPSTAIGFEAAFRVVDDAANGRSLVDAGVNLGGVPDLGPSFTAKLQNLSGGGVGLVVPNEHSALLSSAPYLWLQIDLRPELKSPLAVTARRAHEHMDFSHNICVGLAFDFTHHPAHQRFVTQTLGSYVGSLMARGAAAA